MSKTHQKPTEKESEPGMSESSDNSDKDKKKNKIDEPVDVLVSLAKEGEIDPWDIDIVKVTDKFLERLDEGDLARSGRAILYASMLLRMKSDYLVEEDEEDEEEEIDPETAMMHEWGLETDDEYDESEFHNDPIDELEREMDRRIERRKVRQRANPKTLDELVRDLREMEKDSWWKDSREYDTSKENGKRAGFDTIAPPSTREATTEEAMSTAHQNDMEARIDETWEKLEKEFKEREEVLFRELIYGKDKKGVVNTYLSLLFLANRGKIELEQDEMYDDLWISEGEGEESRSMSFGTETTPAP